MRNDPWEEMTRARVASGLFELSLCVANPDLVAFCPALCRHLFDLSIADEDASRLGFTAFTSVAAVLLQSPMAGVGEEWTLVTTNNEALPLLRRLTPSDDIFLTRAAQEFLSVTLFSASKIASSSSGTSSFSSSPNNNNGITAGSTSVPSSANYLEGRQAAVQLVYHIQSSAAGSNHDGVMDLSSAEAGLPDHDTAVRTWQLFKHVCSVFHVIPLLQIAAGLSATERSSPDGPGTVDDAILLLEADESLASWVYDQQSKKDEHNNEHRGGGGGAFNGVLSAIQVISYHWRLAGVGSTSTTTKRHRQRRQSPSPERHEVIPAGSSSNRGWIGAVFDALVVLSEYYQQDPITTTAAGGAEAAAGPDPFMPAAASPSELVVVLPEQTSSSSPSGPEGVSEGSAASTVAKEFSCTTSSLRAYVDAQVAAVKVGPRQSPVLSSPGGGAAGGGSGGAASASSSTLHVAPAPCHPLQLLQCFFSGKVCGTGSLLNPFLGVDDALAFRTLPSSTPQQPVGTTPSAQDRTTAFCLVSLREGQYPALELQDQSTVVLLPFNWLCGNIASGGPIRRSIDRARNVVFPHIVINNCRHVALVGLSLGVRQLWDPTVMELPSMRGPEGEDSNANSSRRSSSCVLKAYGAPYCVAVECNVARQHHVFNVVPILIPDGLHHMQGSTAATKLPKGNTPHNMKPTLQPSSGTGRRSASRSGRRDNNPFADFHDDTIAVPSSHPPPPHHYSVAAPTEAAARPDESHVPSPALTSGLYYTAVVLMYLIVGLLAMWAVSVPGGDDGARCPSTLCFRSLDATFTWLIVVAFMTAWQLIAFCVASAFIWLLMTALFPNRVGAVM